MRHAGICNSLISGLIRTSYGPQARHRIEFSVKAMEQDPLRQRQHAHDLIDALPLDKLGTVRNLLEYLVEPLSRSLAAAPVEEEDLTPETAADLDRSRASLDRGEGISHEEILREFGV